MKNSQKRMAVLGGLVAWWVFALAIDRYVLREHLPWFSELLYFRDAEIVVQPFSRKFSWLGLSLLLVAPSFVVGVCLAIYLRLRKKMATRESFAVFGYTAFWFLLIPVLVWIGHTLFRFFKSFLDDLTWAKGIVAFLGGFTFKGDLYIYSFKVVTIDSGLGALVGLALGIALLYRKGLWGIIEGQILP
jgi:hypothetical protein